MQTRPSRHYLFSILFCISGLFLPSSASPNCDPCKAEHEALSKHAQTQNEYENLLKRNQDYLEKNKSDPSKVVKVQSNLFLLNVKIESEKNYRMARTKDVKTKCPTCALAEGLGLTE